MLLNYELFIICYLAPDLKRERDIKNKDLL